MAIIVGLCLITPKIAKKIDQWREQKKTEIKSDKQVDPSNAEQPTDDPFDGSENTNGNKNTNQNK